MATASSNDYFKLAVENFRLREHEAAQTAALIGILIELRNLTLTQVPYAGGPEN